MKLLFKYNDNIISIDLINVKITREESSQTTAIAKVSLNAIQNINIDVLSFTQELFKKPTELWNIVYNNTLVFSGYLNNIVCNDLVVISLTTSLCNTPQEDTKFPQEVFFIDENCQKHYTCPLNGNNSKEIVSSSPPSWKIKNNAPSSLNLLIKTKKNILKHYIEDISPKILEEFRSTILSKDNLEELFKGLEEKISKTDYKIESWCMRITNEELSSYLFTGQLSGYINTTQQEEINITIRNYPDYHNNNIINLEFDISNKGSIESNITDVRNCIQRAITYINYYNRNLQWEFICSLEEALEINTNCYLNIKNHNISGKVIKCVVIKSCDNSHGIITISTCTRKVDYNLDNLNLYIESVMQGDYSILKRFSLVLSEDGTSKINMKLRSPKEKIIDRIIYKAIVLE